MSQEMELAGEYRKHAKALRAAANFEEDAGTSIMLKKLASRYEHVAVELEGIDGTNKGIQRAHRWRAPHNGDGRAT